MAFDIIIICHKFFIGANTSLVLHTHEIRYIRLLPMGAPHLGRPRLSISEQRGHRKEGTNQRRPASPPSRPIGLIVVLPVLWIYVLGGC